MPGTAQNIFISYGRADARDLAIRLRDDLQTVGYSVWLDLNDIAGGANWSQKIEEAIEHCHVMVALLSPHAYQSQWCRAEQLRAIRKGKQLVPLLAIPESEVPLHLEHMNYLDFSNLDEYNEKFRDLLSDLTASVAFLQPGTTEAIQGRGSPYKKGRQRPRTGFQDEKRTAPAMRRYLQDLRQEEWLGARFWWPYFLFRFTDIHTLIDILKEEEICSPYVLGERVRNRYNKFVHLYFRPRTPDLFRAEGFRPSAQNRPKDYAPIPAYLLFDLEAVICQPDTIFAEGDPAKVKKTYKTASYFKTLPFEQIYHDSWFASDEREEILRCREAQVLIPERLGLESLQLIWLRSPAEYETLRHLMSPDLWEHWHDKITARTDYHLFNNKRVYVQQAIMQDDSVRFRYNPSQNASDNGPFLASVVVEYDDGEQVTWEDEQYTPNEDLLIQLPRKGQYGVQLLLDGDVAYAGEYQTDTRSL